MSSINTCMLNFCLDVASMTRPHTNCVLNEYETAVDEIVAAHDGDVRGALKALSALNQLLESQLERMSELLVGRAAAPRVSIH